MCNHIDEHFEMNDVIDVKSTHKHTSAYHTFAIDSIDKHILFTELFNCVFA